MKKWNRALAILLAAGLTAGLCGCESGADNPSSLPPAPASQAMPDAATPEPTPTPTPEPTPEPTPTPEPELHGLIYTEFNTFNSVHSSTVYCLNPETGETTVISKFDSPRNLSQGYYTRGDGKRRWTFSEDFSKITCTRYFSNDGAGKHHAGWMDTDGNFFDVTEALGLQAKSDFDPPESQYSSGFFNGFFQYADNTGKKNDYSNTSKIYHVPVDNLTPGAIQEGSARATEYPYDADWQIQIDKKTYYLSDVTSWIDDTHCIVDHYFPNIDRTRDSFIVDISAQTKSKYIPGDSRDNWSGIISPDGTKIAFASSPRNSTPPETGIYIVPIIGGDPVKVAEFPYNQGHSFTVIDWI